MHLGEHELRDLAAISDADGVLSVYVDADPREESSSRPAWQLRINNDLKAIRKQLANGTKHAVARFDQQLAELGPALDQLQRAAEPGRGRALFAPLGDGAVRILSLQLPMPDLAVLKRAAYVRPLVTAANVGAPAGIATISRDGIRLLDLRLGTVVELPPFVVTVDTSDWHELRGPASASSGRAQHGITHTDRYQKRVSEHIGQSIRAAADHVAAWAHKQGWLRLAVLGDARLTEQLIPALPAELADITVTSAQTVGSQTAAQLAAATAPLLEQTRLAAELAVVQAARAAAAARNAGAIGLDDVLSALNEGRVAHLLLDGGREWAGHQTADGQLFANDESPPGVPAATVSVADDLGEVMIERALGAGSHITMVTETAAAELSDVGGVAALLRW